MTKHAPLEQASANALELPIFNIGSAAFDDDLNAKIIAGLNDRPHNWFAGAFGKCR